MARPTRCSAAVSLAEKWSERGLVPRVIERVFADSDAGRLPRAARLSFTFIEIYNENVYDLFNNESAQSNPRAPGNTRSDKKVKLYSDVDLEHRFRSLVVLGGDNLETVYNEFLRGSFNRKASLADRRDQSKRHLIPLPLHLYDLPDQCAYQTPKHKP